MEKYVINMIIQSFCSEIEILKELMINSSFHHEHYREMTVTFYYHFDFFVFFQFFVDGFDW